MQGDCRVSVSNRKQVVCRPPLGVDTRLDWRPPPLHASRSASGVAMTVEIEGAGMTAAAHVNRDSVGMVSQRSGEQIPNVDFRAPGKRPVALDGAPVEAVVGQGTPQNTVRRARRPRAPEIRNEKGRMKLAEVSYDGGITSLSHAGRTIALRAQRPYSSMIGMLIMMIGILSGALAALSTSGAELTEQTSRKAAGRMVSSHYDVAAMRVVGCEAPSIATCNFFCLAPTRPHRRKSVV